MPKKRFDQVLRLEDGAVLRIYADARSGVNDLVKVHGFAGGTLYLTAEEARKVGTSLRDAGNWVVEYLYMTKEKEV